MISFPFHIRALKATAIAASKDAPQPELKGVCIQPDGNGLIFVATDAYRIIASRHELSTPLSSFREVIVPLSLIKRVKLHKTNGLAKMTLETKEDCGVSITIDHDGATYTEDAVSIPYPQWRKAIPHSVSGEVAQYNPGYLADFKEAGHILDGGKYSPLISVSHNGKSPALVRICLPDENPIESFGIIMPLRAKAAPTLDAPPSWARTATNKPETVATASRDDVEAAALKAVEDALTA
jgi:DNA polymerase-3 subunit beta